jgi:AcrR family transcriptional regulator
MVTEREQRKEREYLMRRALILSQAEKIFSRKGYHDVTVAEIAAASGFSTGFLYQFFEGKEHLYKTMISEKIDWMYESIERRVNDAAEMKEKISVLTETSLRFVEENPDLCRVILRGQGEALSIMMTDIREKLLQKYFRHLSFVEKIFQKGIEIGFLRELPARQMAHLLMHIIRATSFDWLMVHTGESLVSKKDFILDVYFNGVKKG